MHHHSHPAGQETEASFNKNKFADIIAWITPIAYVRYDYSAMFYIQRWQAISESKGDRLPSSAECRVRILEV